MATAFGNMKDLTKNSIVRHLLTIAGTVAVGTVAQLAYQIIDLYFIAQLGAANTAGVNAASSIVFIIMSLTQILATGTAMTMAHATGRKDSAEANSLFNQSLCLAVLSGLLMVAILYPCAPHYLRSIAADEEVVESGRTFVMWALPGYFLLIPWTTMASALRGTGLVGGPTIAFALSVVVNAVLAPVLIAGWGMSHALGVRGAGIATSLSIVVGTTSLVLFVRYRQQHLRFRMKSMWPRMRQCRRILSIGLPAGTDLALTFFSTAVIYFAIRDFGTTAQAGFSIAWRLLQAIIVPCAALALAAGPIIGQNFGAGHSDRVRETFWKATLITTATMIAMTTLLQWRPDVLINVFAAAAPTLEVATSVLKYVSWTLVAQGVVQICSSTFQGLGNTVPSLVASLVRFVAFAFPAMWLSSRRGMRIEHVWHLLIAAIFVQAFLSLLLLRITFRRRLLLAHM